MSTEIVREIPREDWVSFFNNFSRRHDRWLVTVEVLGADLGAQVEGRSLRFEGINADVKGGENRITIDLGHGLDESMTRTVSSPAHVWVGQTGTTTGTFETLDIEAADGTTTLVRFLAGVVPEDV